MKYSSLRNSIKHLKKGDTTFDEISSYILESQFEGNPRVVIKNLFSLHREQEHTSFREALHNKKLLFHGSNASNFVGLLSRGVLMPKLVVAMGGKRRDAGLLGNGIYYGDSVDTSAQYCRAGTF